MDAKEVTRLLLIGATSDTRMSKPGVNTRERFNQAIEYVYELERSVSVRDLTDIRGRLTLDTSVARASHFPSREDEITKEVPLEPKHGRGRG